MTIRTSLRALLSSVVSLAALFASAGTASANDLFTLDAKPTSPGHLIVDGAGTAYVGWTSDASGSSIESAMFCRIPAGSGCPSPLTLPIPGATGSADEVSGVFPVFSQGGTVYAVGPRYIRDDVVIWTSTDGGLSFDAGTVSPGGYSNKTDPSNVVLSGSDFLIAGFNSGLGFSSAPAAGGAGANFSFANAGSGGVAGSSLALDSAGSPVLAYWNLSDPYGVLFYRYDGSGPVAMAGNWEGPTGVSNGYQSKLAGGPAGLYLVSEDYAGGKYPTALNVRRYSGTGFDAPVTLANDSTVDLFDGGTIAQAAGGRLAVAWPGVRSGDGASIMRLFTSTDGGASFGASIDIAHLGSGYPFGDNAQLALTDSGAGWLTFRDQGGLRVADLNPVAGLPPSKPPTYKGKDKKISKPVGDYLLTLRLPGSCLKPNQAFYTGAGRRVRRKVAKAVKSKLTLTRAAFSFDGRKLKTLKKKPFKLLIDPGPLPSGSVHTVKVRVTAIARKGGKKKKVVRTLKGRVSIC